MTNRDKLAAYKLEIVPLPQAEGGGYQAYYPQLGRTTVGYGETAGEALNDLAAGLDSLIEALDETGDELPTPDQIPVWSEFSGRVTLRLAKSLHYRLDKLAQAEGVSLNSILNDILQSGATALEAGLILGGREPDTYSQVSNMPIVNASSHLPVPSAGGAMHERSVSRKTL